MQKEKMFVVASNIDDSIKSLTPVYDISIFPTFLQLEELINTTPLKVGTIVISERELPFSNVNMAKLLDMLSAYFLKLTGNCIYLISEETPKQIVVDFLEDNKITNIMIYQGDLSLRFISDIITGAARISDEAETEIVTYRYRASEYAAMQNIKKYQSDDDLYTTDEEQLTDIPPIDEPLIQVPATEITSSTYYVVGKRSMERTLFAFIEAQYLSLTGKTVILESDIEYHRLLDMVSRSGLAVENIDIRDFLTMPLKTIQRIKNSNYMLITITSIDRLEYDYNFIFDILESNLTGWVDYFVKECDFSQTPYGSYYNIVCADTVPDVLECCNSIAYDIDENKVIFIGLRTSNETEVNITSSELTDIIRTVLDKDTLPGQVFVIDGITLKGGELVYDIFSIIARGNQRQG